MAVGGWKWLVAVGSVLVVFDGLILCGGGSINVKPTQVKLRGGKLIGRYKSHKVPVCQ